jgi:hypothetical protein
MSKLTEAVEAKLAAEGVSATAAAKSVGLSLPSFRAVLKGKSTPNARGVKKYAKLLGISDEEALAMVAADGGGKKRGRKAGAKPGRKAGAKRGPKPGRKAGAKRGPKPGRKAGAKPGRKPGRKAATGEFASAIALLSQAEALMGDSLAIAVHNLGKAQRATIEMIVSNLG